MSTEKSSCILKGIEQLFVLSALCTSGLTPYVSEADECKTQPTRQPDITKVPSAENLTFFWAHTRTRHHPTQSKATNRPRAFQKASLSGFTSSDGEELVTELEGLCRFPGYVLGTAEV